MKVGDTVTFTITVDNGPRTPIRQETRTGQLIELTEPSRLKDGLEFSGLAGIVVDGLAYIVRRDQVKED